MTILVTGGAGFIGAHFILYLMKTHRHIRVLCLDKLTYAADLSYLSPVIESSRFRFVKGDICDRETVNRLFEEEHPDMVVNFAAESHVDRSIEDPALFLKTNILGTGVLLDGCRTYGIRRFHQVSTDEVYGDLPLGRPDLLFTEDSPLDPHSPYSSSKASADLLALACRRTYGVPVTISRCSNNYGPFQYPEKLIPLTIRRALANEPIPLYGDGKNVRDWIYVEDHCRAIDLILQKGMDGDIYNIGGSCEISNIDLIRRILHILGRPDSLITPVKDRPGHDRRYGMDTKKIRSHLGWQAETDFEKGLEKTVAWYVERFGKMGK